MSGPDNKIAFVVGSSSGIGAAIVQRFVAKGANVYATSRKAEDGSGSESAGAGAIRAVKANSSSIADLEQVFV
jgi:NAD(P)-dependent dehydrogenase (short-subunit alcohol dehydrogenase family)